MAYKLEKISHFEAKRMIQYLEQSNDGKGDYNENRITLRIQDKIDDCGRKSVHKADSPQEVYNYCLTEEEKKKGLTQVELEELIPIRQEEKWDDLFLSELILENDEFDVLKKALDTSQKQYFKARAINRRMQGLLEKIQNAKSFDLNTKSKKEPEQVKK